MFIKNRFSGDIPDCIIDVHMSVMDIYDRIPEYWKEKIEDLYVIVSDQTLQECMHAMTADRSGKCIILGEFKPDLIDQICPMFTWSFVKLFLNCFPRFIEVIQEQGKACRRFYAYSDSLPYHYSVLIDPEDVFVISYYHFLTNPKNMHDKVRSFMTRIDQQVKFGHLSLNNNKTIRFQ